MVLFSLAERLAAIKISNDFKPSLPSVSGSLLPRKTSITLL